MTYTSFPSNISGFDVIIHLEAGSQFSSLVQCQVCAQDCKEDLVFSVGQVAVHLVHFTKTK